MGDMSEFSWRTRLFLSTYPWRRVEPALWSPLRTPVSAARVALCSSAGFTAPGQAPFDDTVRGGDSTFRLIPDHTPTATLHSSHRSATFDHAGIDADANLALPLDRLHELVGQGLVGAAAPRHLSFMGSITTPGRLIRDGAPRAAQALAEDQVDLALFVPV
jgi:D-proline reductase (dithiol) PrdB